MATIPLRWRASAAALLLQVHHHSWAKRLPIAGFCGCGYAFEYFYILYWHWTGRECGFNVSIYTLALVWRVRKRLVCGVCGAHGLSSVPWAWRSKNFARTPWFQNMKNNERKKKKTTRQSANIRHTKALLSSRNVSPLNAGRHVPPYTICFVKDAICRATYSEICMKLSGKINISNYITVIECDLFQQTKRMPSNIEKQAWTIFVLYFVVVFVVVVVYIYSSSNLFRKRRLRKCYLNTIIHIWMLWNRTHLLA